MTNLKFSHWFWITAITVVFQGQLAHCINDSEAKLLQVYSSDNFINSPAIYIEITKKESSERDAHSIGTSQPKNYLETAEFEDQPEFSTSKSVSVSRVRVEVSKVRTW